MTRNYHAAAIIATVLSGAHICGCPSEPTPIHADAGTGGMGGAPPLPRCNSSEDCPATPDECHVATCEFDGSCSYGVPAPAGNVCGNNEVCDGNGSCVTAGKTCVANADCDDGNGCTGDVCYNASHTCGHYAVPECTPKMCTQSSDCDDGNPCTNDVCHTFDGTCFHDNLSDGTPCAGGFCVSGVCK